MAELWINWRDESGEGGRVRVDNDVFTIGRHSSCDLAIPNAKLSREHIRIERSGDRFLVEDSGSSNGTDLNGAPLIEPVELQNGDRANLGGGVDIDFEYVWDKPGSLMVPAVSPVEASVSEASLTADAPPSATGPTTGPGGFPIGLLIIGPLAALVLLLGGIGLLYIFSAGRAADDDTDRNIRTRRDRDDDDDDHRTPSRTPSTTSSPGGVNSTPSGNVAQPSPANLGENAKIEQNAAAFLRRIAQNDPNAFLTAEQAQKVSSRVKQFGGSSALAGNIENARKASPQIKALAATKNLPPQLLATAALTKLGNSRGDVLQTAQSMSGILERLNTQIGSELFDDSLMMIAAYDQGERGEFMRLRNTLQDLATKFPESSRAIRSIWFLQKQNKITDAEFDLALRFLAIGTITQNPKEFGVNAEPLTL